MSTPNTPPTYYNPSTALADLGHTRAEADVAAVGDRDTAFFSNRPITVAKGVAPKGLEHQVFAWTAMRHVADEGDGGQDKDELKGDLHGGQLHRANRVARGEVVGGGGGGGFAGRGGGYGGKGGRRGGGFGGHGYGNMGQSEEGVTVAMKPVGRDVWPLAKGFAEELKADMFWDGPIVKG